MTPLPCKFDHNGECLICDCSPSACGWMRLWTGDWRYEPFEELLALFKDHLTPEQVAELRAKHEQRGTV